MERARYNTGPYSNQSPPLKYNVKPSNFWGSHHLPLSGIFIVAQHQCLGAVSFGIKAYDVQNYGRCLLHALY